tara:strand:+ start:541 stop:852 length:312 start_codon:yes stop_codon:yes gene_type:complete
MKQLLLTSILILIIATSLVKNSTKKIEDKSFVLSENIRSLKSELGDLKLEYNYLSSPEKLIRYQSQYFENDLVKIDISKIKKMSINGENIMITDFLEKTKANE